MFVNGERCIFIENDVVNCFDRIIPVIAALAFYQLGLETRIICMLLLFLEAAQHHVMINGTPSEVTYTNTEQTPVMGSSQGTGWDGPSCCVVADLIPEPTRTTLVITGREDDRETLRRNECG